MRGTTHPHRPYQGYPYVNPPVNDAPSVDPTTAARWNNLPRKQIELPVNRIEPPSVYNKLPHGAPGVQPRAVPIEQVELEPSPVVYIDMPEASGSCVSSGRGECSGEEEADPSIGDKVEPTDQPVVYVDLPNGDGSEVACSRTHDHTTEPDYVQETILFNPFESHMEEHKQETPDSESDEESSTASHTSRRPAPPARRHHLDVTGAGSSAAGSSGSPPRYTSRLPDLASKQSMVYGQHDLVSPLPASEFPAPPPAYSEVDTVRVEAGPREPVVEEPPRVQVILPREPAAPAGPAPRARKYLTCQHCGARVHTLVVSQTGTHTHILAAVCAIVCMIPCIAFIYCTDVFKIKNHYCPNCNKIIGRQPLCGRDSDDIVYYI